MSVATSPALRYSKGLWSYNPLPVGCVFYWPGWHTDLRGVHTSADPFQRVCTPTNGPVKVAEGFDFDKVDDYISIPTEAVNFGNIFDGGGTLMCWFRPDGEGEGTVGMFFSLAGSIIQFGNLAEAAGKTKSYFVHLFSVANGVWNSTATVFTNDTVCFCAITYNSSVGGDPIEYISDNGGALTTLTVGSGLTKATAPSGTRTDGAAATKYIGSTAGGNTTDGTIIEMAAHDSILTAAQVGHYFNNSYPRRFS